jgi:Na+-driven multidrug efflux pump
MRAYTGSFRGAGKTMVAAAIAITMLGLIRLPVAWVGAQQMGSNGVWLAFSVSNAAGALIAYTWYRRGTWRDADATRGPDPDVGAAADD